MKRRKTQKCVIDSYLNGEITCADFDELLIESDMDTNNWNACNNCMLVVPRLL